MLEVRAITVQFGGVRPLDDVTLAFLPGVTGLVGPNGAGKTTMLNVLSGFTRPDVGSVAVGRTDLLSMSPHGRARWGLRRTFQREQVIHELSAYDNLRLAAENLGADRGSVGRVLETVRLPRPWRKAAGLSMLERRLVEIGRTMLTPPKVVLLDEPGAGLGQADAAVLVPLIRRLAEDHEGCVIVLVDHDMGLVSTVCRDIAVLDFGKRIAFGRTAEVLGDPVVRRAYLGNVELV